MLSAALDKKLAVVKAALTAGVDVDAQEKDWKPTAMHYAAMMDQPQLFVLPSTRASGRRATVRVNEFETGFVKFTERPPPSQAG